MKFLKVIGFVLFVMKDVLGEKVIFDCFVCVEVFELVI